MSLLGNSNVKSVDTDPPMLSHQEALEQLRVFRERMPEFVQLPNDRALKAMRRKAGVNIDFAREAINAVGTSPVVQGAIGNTQEELLHAEDELNRWTTVEAELRAVVRGVAAANLIRRYRLAQVALQTYNVSRELVRQEEHADLLPHVESMSRLPKFNRRRKATAAKPADPTKVPQPVKA
jgi:hypothetical protein